MPKNTGENQSAGWIKEGIETQTPPMEQSMVKNTRVSIYSRNTEAVQANIDE